MKVLILDDDKALCEIISSVLGKPNIFYDIFQDPLKAIIAMEVGEYDFAFVDIGLPHMDGLEFSKRFKAKHPQSDIVFITGSGDYDKALKDLDGLIASVSSSSLKQYIYFVKAKICFIGKKDKNAGIENLKTAERIAPNTEEGKKLSEMIKQLEAME